MKKIILILFFTSFTIIHIAAQSQFQRTIGGTNNDQAYSIIQTTDGGYVAAGYTYSFATVNMDIYIVKLNSSGTLQWTKTIGGTSEELASSIIQTTDGGFALAGYTRPTETWNSDFYIVKLDATGSFQWSRTLDRANYDFATSIIQTTAGGFAIGGYSATGGVFTDDIYIVKLDTGGTYQWSKTYGGSHDDIAYSIIQTTDGGFALAGLSDSYGPYNVFYITKLDSSGMLQWNRLIGETGTGGDAACIIQTTDGGFALAGEFTPTGTGNYRMYIVKLSSSGTLQWTRTLGGTGNEKAQSIIQTADGDFVVAGYTNSFGAGNYDMYIAKLNSSGSLVWSKTVGGIGDDQAQSISKTNDGGFVVAGYTESFGAGAKDIYIVKFDANGNTCGNSFTPSTISGTSGTLETPSTIVTTQNPIVNSPTPTINSGGTLTTICFVEPPQIPLPPTLISPINSAINQPTTIRFNWNKSQSATSYRFQLALDSLFTNMVVNDSTFSDSTALVVNLLNNTTYWWRVNAKNSVGTSPYSAVWHFRTVLAIPSAPILISPVNGATGQSLTPTLIWSGVSGAVTYKAQVSNDSLFSSTLLDSAGIPLTQVIVPAGRLLNNHRYYWRVNATNTAGTGPWSVVFHFNTLLIGLNPVGCDIPKEYKLYNNYPNPFNSVTKIKIDIPEISFTKLVIYDILGREVAILVNEKLSPGTYEVEWDASNYPSGVYFYKLTAGDFTQTKKLVLLK